MSTTREITFTLNGRRVSTEVKAGETIVDMLTNRFDLRGARESCGQGLCGCCSVTVDGKAVSGCLSMAWLLDGTSVQTIEGVAKGGALDPVQEAFIEASAFQCGFCTPGFIMMVRQLLDANPDPDDEEIRHYLVGNLCRCSSYPEILDAVKLAAAKRRRASVAAE